MESSFNPAAVGKQAKLNVTAAYALDMAGFEHNPRTMYLAADMPFLLFNHQQGVGVSLMNDQIGLFTHQRLSLQYAYKKKIWGGMKSIGLQGSMLSESFDGSKVDAEESGDPAFATTNVEGSGMDFALGLYFIHRNWYVGLSGQHLTSPTINLGDSNEFKIDATYYLTGGYNIQLKNPLIELQPSVFLLTDMSSFHADITARLEYNKMFNGGISYRVNESVGILLGVKIGRFQAGYAYDFPITAMGQATSGSHELCVRYALKLKKTTTGKNRHKSVRIL